MENLLQLVFLQAESFQVQENGFLHCKTVPYYILAQAYEGHYELEAGGVQGICEEGGAFFTPPNVPLRIRHYVNPSTGRMCVRYFHFMLRDEQGIDPFAGRKVPLAVSARDCLGPARLLVRLMKAKRGFEREALALELAGRLYDLTEPAVGGAPVPEEILRVCNWIHQHVGAGATVGQLLSQYGRARSHFYSEFLKWTHMSPAAYFRRERIRNAAALMLQNQQWSIKEVSDRCGWNNPYHFSRVFKAVLGASPCEYRNNVRLDGLAGKPTMTRSDAAKLRCGASASG